MSAPSKSIFRKFRRSLLYLAVVFAVCVGGYHVYGWNLVDSVYMVVITMFGVGYGEVHPLDADGKIFTMFVIVAGTSAVVFVIGEVIRFITEGEIMKAIGELKKSKQVEGISFVVVDLDDARLALAEESGYLFVKGSATEEETLQRAHVERAVVLATVLPQDTLNVFITLTARNLNKQLRIIARGEHPPTEKKLRQAGADEVVLPASIGGTRIAHSIIRPATMEYLGDNSALMNEELKKLGVEIDELRLHKHTHLVGKTILELQNLSEGHLIVIALQRANGNILRSGFLEENLQTGDSVIIIGRVHSLPPALRGEVDREEMS